MRVKKTVKKLRLSYGGKCFIYWLQVSICYIGNKKESSVLIYTVFNSYYCSWDSPDETRTTDLILFGLVPVLPFKNNLNSFVRCTNNRYYTKSYAYTMFYTWNTHCIFIVFGIKLNSSRSSELLCLYKFR